MRSLVQRHDKLCSVAAYELHRANALPWYYSHLVQHNRNDDMQHSFIPALLVPEDLLPCSHWPAFKTAYSQTHRGGSISYTFTCFSACECMCAWHTCTYIYHNHLLRAGCPSWHLDMITDTSLGHVSLLRSIQHMTLWYWVKVCSWFYLFHITSVI